MSEKLDVEARDEVKDEEESGRTEPMFECHESSSFPTRVTSKSESRSPEQPFFLTWSLFSPLISISSLSLPIIVILPLLSFLLIPFLALLLLYLQPREWIEREERKVKDLERKLSSSRGQSYSRVTGIVHEILSLTQRELALVVYFFLLLFFPDSWESPVSFSLSLSFTLSVSFFAGRILSLTGCQFILVKSRLVK